MTATVATAAASLGGVQQVSSDTFTTGSQHATEVEPSAVANGNVVVSAFQVGRYNAGDGAMATGWATSGDGGTTWTNGILPAFTTSSSPPGTYARTADPTTAYDGLHGVWLIGSLGMVPSGSGFVNQALVVSRSTDGTTWSSPVTVSSANAPDKDWLTCDNWPTSPRRGTCYAAWSNNSQSDLIKTSTSTDGGATWSAPVGIGAATGYDIQLIVQPSGAAVLVADQGGSPPMIVSSRSTDGGASWSAPLSIVATRQSHTVAGGMRAHIKPSVSVDGGGTVYLVWPDCRFRSGCASNDVVMMTSADGVTWSPVTRIPIDETTSTVDHFLAGIGADPATSGSGAHLGLVYYYYPTSACGSSCQLSVGYTASNDGGANWSQPSTLNASPMDPTWFPLATGGRMAGDYFPVAFLGNGNAVTVAAIAKAPPTSTTFDVGMYTAVFGPPALAAPTNQAPPTIAGTAASGSTLTVSAGTWGGTRPFAYTHQWQRCDSAGANCANVAGQTASSYLLVAADVGSKIRVVETATNTAGTQTAASTPTATITAASAAPANTAPPTVSGTPQQGQTLTVTAGSWSGTPTPNLSEQWQRCDSAGANCANVAGQTASSYLLVAADVGSKIRVVETATNTAGTQTAASTPTATITAATAPTTPLLDDFNRPDTTGPPSPNWSNFPVSSTVATNDLHILTNQLAGYTNSNADYWNVQPFAADSEAYITVAAKPTNAGDGIGLGLRFQNPGTKTANGYQAYFYNQTGTDTYQIGKRVNGAFTSLATVTGPELSAGDKLWFNATGNKLTLYRYNAGTWKLVLQTTDTTYTTGGYLELNARNTTFRLDDFGGGNT
jgi:uncharacterized protein YmfQ (DUF2313 family)